ncbi:MAG: hypothetical protein KY455_10040 [Euryarchaeota archaeon]|nr:hypothetical protein [Euryarchaeota archaeon]
MIGWGSILLVTRLPLDTMVHRRHVQAAGGVALALLGLILLGLPVPLWSPVATLFALPALGRVIRGRPERD